jgi:hypothetical protein
VSGSAQNVVGGQRIEVVGHSGFRWAVATCSLDLTECYPRQTAGANG